MLKWIQERITCHIPDKKSDPELHNFVTRYQMHKCSSYCKRKRKVGSEYITRCRFNFPRYPCETAKLNSVSESLKSRNRIYELARTESEIRVNDYNPLLLILWKASIDVQVVSGSCLTTFAGMLQKLRRVACKRFGTRLVKVRACTVASGVLECALRVWLV